MEGISKVQKYRLRLESLRSERSSFITHWGELSDYILAHRGRFLLSDRNKGHKRNTAQMNNTARMASRTLSAGMMAGVTSPARPWFKLDSGDPDLDEYGPVKDWLMRCERLIYRVFSSSNAYNSLHALYADLGDFAVGAMGIFPDYKDVIRCKVFPIGSYMLATDGHDRVDTFYREYSRRVSQLVKEFGEENLPDYLRERWKNGGSEEWVDCVHVIEPNDNRDHMSPLAKDKKFRSAYFDNTQGHNPTDFFRESGFDDFPILTPRWEIAGEDIYGTDCPGMTALGDTKALQLGEKRMYQGVDKSMNPPMQGDSDLKAALKGRQPNPGETVWHSKGGNGLSSIYGSWRPDLKAVQQINYEAEVRIKKAFFEDLFLMMVESDRRQITATEVAEKHEEKLLILGPVLQRLFSELLDPMIDRTFNLLARAGALPVPPQELQEKELNVEYVSILAQAQKLVAVNGIERTIGFVGNVAQFWPEVLNKIDGYEVVDAYVDAMGTDSNIVRSTDDAKEATQAQNQQAQQQQILEQQNQLAQTAKMASETDTENPNALTNLLRNNGLQP